MVSLPGFPSLAPLDKNEAQKYCFIAGNLLRTLLVFDLYHRAVKDVHYGGVILLFSVYTAQIPSAMDWREKKVPA